MILIVQCASEPKLFNSSFESIANDNNVLQFNWLVEKSNMLRNQERKGGIGRGDICSFSMSFGNTMSSENLSNLYWTCPERLVPFLFLREALMANGILFLSFCQTVIMYYVYKSTTRPIFVKWSFKIFLPSWISTTD